MTDGDDGGRAAAEVVCVGETMALLTPVDARPLLERPRLEMALGGAESNVACGLAGLGHRAAWLSRVGDDPFGALVRAEVAARGVDTAHVEVDPDRPTGVYFKDPRPGGTRVHYYRRGSAAAAMDAGLAARPGTGAVLRGARIVHLSGITPVLSESCAELTDELLVRRAVPGPLLSFDVNHRPALWSAQQAAEPLLRLARAADLVFVGRDEAQTLWGTGDPAAIRRLLGSVPAVVVKDAGEGATLFAADGPATFVPALRVPVVEPVGAGDAFAAGYLSGLLDGRDPVRRLRLGHLLAAMTLRQVGDLAEPPPAGSRERLIGLSEHEWAGARLPGPEPAAADLP
ncbi:sugar kinase [Allonocardiopsis opalescens]|uniref:2-dehydro-3-deoxygluconokinase n=1 Tax=Allonocardiopsis opalescens TaxID=1144618 RepID=A0A2T0QAD0_9ACTN|nr:sugar kinase [Allonocardiopsis opalescens]PRY00807.1 2-dehydro-3-deoxygluconokinase [Allonocardiopsis opalescens]